MKKKVLAIGSTMLLMTPLAAISCVDVSVKGEFKKTAVEFRNLASGHYPISSNQINLYFKRGNKNSIPYVAIEDMSKTLGGFYKRSYWNKKLYSKEGKVRYDASGLSILGFNSIVFDFVNDTIEIDSPYFFQTLVRNSSQTNYSRQIKTKGEDIKEQSTKYVYDLGKYHIDIVYENSKTLIPFSVYNTLFCSQNYYNMYFNGDTVLGTFFDLSDRTQGIEEFKSQGSIWLSQKAQNDYQRLDNYYNLLFTLDHFYGLKKIKNIDSFEKFIDKDQKALLISNDPTKYNEAYSNLFYKKLNELHTSLRMYGFHTNPTQKIDDAARNKSEEFKESTRISNKLKQARKTLQEQHDAKKFLIKDNTAYIIFDEFHAAADKDLKLPDYGKDTFETIREKLDTIATKHPQVKNVVFDISQNGGGNIGAMLRTLGLLTNKDIKTHSLDTLWNINSTTTYQIDANKDNNFNDDDAFSQFNYFILTGKNTFSAANMFAAAAKELKIAKIIGQKSGGGTASIIPIVLQDGTSTIISSQDTGWFINDDKKQDLEFGVPVDIEISYDDFYDLNLLVTEINK
ncbi:S41 family peptidase [Mycoplasma enhydrae]|uniref:S41 family peptidase n=1 Tax=Mycoplasma enhydrae TaxID=2499220 RepID=UPI0021E7223B|nr:S41 family peptidase [Mycoplasma enhydrae]MCV3733923.1 S41 family peptidase [Mycoplasma enhydrae]